jgi:glycosyltransferase involved in cell wall biosynthesis
VPDLVRDQVDAHLVRPDDVAAAVAAVQQVIESPAQADALVRSAFHRYITEFTIEHMHDSVMAVYHQVTRRSGLAPRHE